jgi:hypothetical protein
VIDLDGEYPADAQAKRSRRSTWSRNARRPRRSAAARVRRAGLRLGATGDRADGQRSCCHRGQPKLSKVEHRRAATWVTLILFALGGLTLLLALVVTVMIVYTWLTDGIGA